VIQGAHSVGPEADARPDLGKFGGALVERHPDADPAEGERR
jgi:hypothetical protein